jgi:uncharacterized protein with ATP-grasp and redox domains
MNTCPGCLPCLGKNALDAALRSTDDPDLQKKILADCFRMLADNDYQMPPPYYARKILDIACSHTGKSDIYAVEKRRSNQLAKHLVAELPSLPEYNAEDFESRLRLACAGNILDFGIFADLDLSFAMKTIKTAFTKPVAVDAVKILQKKMDSAKRILYILDNCGEAVFDRVFIEPYKDKVTLGVRGKAAFNDVTADDLADCGFDGWEYISNGPVGIPGTILSECDEAFLKEFEAADLIIAKGQGNFETMNEYTSPAAFLFMAKCPAVTRLIGAEMNSIQVRLINLA